MEMGHKGERGIIIPESEEEIQAVVGDAENYMGIASQVLSPALKANGGGSK